MEEIDNKYVHIHVSAGRKCQRQIKGAKKEGGWVELEFSIGWAY